jgi:plasmid maintenance system antidote protein VapI
MAASTVSNLLNNRSNITLDTLFMLVRGIEAELYINIVGKG